MIQLITRGDDSGSSQSANTAILDAFLQGNLKSTSVMVPAPQYEHAVSLFQPHPDLEIGLHAAITNEWDAPRWGPLSTFSEVPSLVQNDASFFTSTIDVWERYGEERRPSNDEIMKEIGAQLERLRADGLVVSYLDTHMCFDWFHGMAECLQKFCDHEGLIYGNAMNDVLVLPQVQKACESEIKNLITQLEACEDGKTYRLIGHPCYLEGDIMEMCIDGSAVGQVAEQRNIQRLFFMDPAVLDACERLGIQAVNHAWVS